MQEHLRDRDEFESHYEDRVQAPARQRGTLPDAGVFLAAGRYQVAAYGGRAEQRLRAAGALLVATVSFDGAAVPALTGGGAGPVRLDALLPYPAG
jgi:hypothetical protein